MPRISEIVPSDSSKLIAMLVDQVSDPFLAALAQRLNRRARSLGYKLIFGSTENDASFLPKLISVFNNMNVDGYIIAPTKGIERGYASLPCLGCPVVLLDSVVNEPGVYAVVPDNFKGAEDAVDHLAEAGFNQIVLVTKKSDQKRVVDQQRGYEAAMKRHRLSARVVRVAAVSEDAAAAAIGEVWKESRPDAFIFADSDLGFAGLAMLREYIPAEVGVVVFDDNENFQLSSLGITTVVKPLDEMVERIFECISGHGPAAGGPIVLPARMVIRHSSLKKAVTGLAAIDNQ